MFRRYLKNTFWFAILCCAISWCLCHMCFLGFYVNPSLQANEALIAACVIVLTAALWLFSYSSRAKLMGIIVLAAAAAVFLAAVYAAGDIGTAVKDTEENPYSFFVIAAAVIIGVWLLAATKRGLIVLLVLGVFISALVAFLYKDNSLAWLCGFLAGCIVCYALRYYCGSVLSSRTVKTSFASIFVVTLAMAAVVVLAAGGVYAGVVKAVDPPAQELKLYDKNKTMTLLGYLGLSKTVTVMDPSDDSDSQEDKSTGRGTEEGDDEEEEKEDEADTDASGGLDGWDERYSENQADVVSYELPDLEIRKWPFALTIVILAAAAVVLKILSGRWRLAAMMKKTKNERISEMYHLWLKKYRRIRLGKNKEETPFEYALRQKDHMAVFADGETDMMRLTGIFVETGYGTREATEQEWQAYLGFYKKFGRMAFKYLGPLRFVIKFFVL